MELDITVKNYRCFPDTTPARFQLRSGFTAVVGANNTGKSTLLKMFFELRDVFQNLSNPGNLVERLRQEQAFSIRPPIADKAELFHNGNRRDITIEVELISSASLQDTLKRIVITVPRDRNTFRITLPDVPNVTDVDRIKIDAEGRLTRREPSPNSGGTGTISSWDTTELRNAMDALSRCLYIGAFRNAINIGTKDDYFDIEIGQAFVKKWRQYKTGGTKEWNQLSYRVADDIARLLNIDRLEINATDDEQSLHVFIDGHAFRLAELGAGIAQLVVVMANAAMKRPSFILIDEPELNLHPSLQLDFLTSLTSYAKHGVCFSTHSIGLARASADRIYSVRMSGKWESEIRDLESTPNLSEFLGEVSFSGYRELGFETILLVEGPTEVRALQQLLRFYKKDHKVVLLPLGGSGMINERSEGELLEVKRISTSVFALIDSEKASASDELAADRAGFQHKCASAGVTCHVLDRRAFENYLTDRAVKAVKGENYSALGPFESLKDANPGWGKRDNWRIAREMNIAELSGTDLGRFLESL